MEYDFGDGSGWATVDTHEYETAGNYTVRVRAYGCGDVYGPYMVEWVRVV